MNIQKTTLFAFYIAISMVFVACGSSDDSNGNEIPKAEHDAIPNPSSCEGKVVEIDGKSYKLTAC